MTSSFFCHRIAKDIFVYRDFSMFRIIFKAQDSMSRFTRSEDMKPHCQCPFSKSPISITNVQPI